MIFSRRGRSTEGVRVDPTLLLERWCLAVASCPAAGVALRARRGRRRGACAAVHFRFSPIEKREKERDSKRQTKK